MTPSPETVPFWISHMTSLNSTKRIRLHPWGVAVLLSIGILVALGFRTQYRTVLVIGHSMWPNYQTGDVLILDRRAYERETPQRGDLVVARYRKDYIFKRIVGLPGETVELKNGQLWLEDARLPEPYRVVPGYLSVGRGRLQEGRYAVVGDNRSMASGESVHGIVGKPDFLGRVRFVLPTGKFFDWWQS